MHACVLGGVAPHRAKLVEAPSGLWWLPQGGRMGRTLDTHAGAHAFQVGTSFSTTMRCRWRVVWPALHCSTLRLCNAPDACGAQWQCAGTGVLRAADVVPAA